MNNEFFGLYAANELREIADAIESDNLNFYYGSQNEGGGVFLALILSYLYSDMLFAVGSMLVVYLYIISTHI